MAKKIFFPFAKSYVHASAVQKFLDSAKEELKSFFGDYSYMIVQRPGPNGRWRYEVHANYALRGEQRHFVDGVGKTPYEALMSVNQMKTFMRGLGWEV